MEASSLPFQVLAKPVGPLCNLDCKYCFYLEKEHLYQGERSWEMPDDVLETFIRQYIASHDSDVVTFAWQGGEPTLLGVPYFKRVLDLQRRFAGGKIIENALQTNAFTIDSEWAQFLAENRFLVGVSIDGPAALHDAYRVDKGGQPTHARVLRGIEHLQAARVEFNTLTVVNRKNSCYPLEVYRFLKQIGSSFLQFIPVVERVATRPAQDGLVLIGPSSREATVSEWSVEPRQYGEFLCAVFDDWVGNDVGQIFVQLFDVALEHWLGLPSSLCVFAETCGSALAIEHQGDVYSCDHYVYPENRLGNIMEHSLLSLAAGAAQEAFGLAKRDTLPAYCKSCDVRFACHGECPKHRFAVTPDGEYGLNYLCAAYKRFFHHIDPCMQFMGRELLARRAPANVMPFARERAARTDSAVLRTSERG